MATSSSLSKYLFLALFLGLFTISNAQLKVGYYSKSCPNAEAIVKKEMDQVMYVAPSLGGPLVRMHFHDCFVRVSLILKTVHTNDHYRMITFIGFSMC